MVEAEVDLANEDDAPTLLPRHGSMHDGPA
jgi:hypothetical protein